MTIAIPYNERNRWCDSVWPSLGHSMMVLVSGTRPRGKMIGSTAGRDDWHGLGQM